MKKGINIWSFPPVSIKENLKLAKDAGFEGVELALNAEGELSMASTDTEILEVKKIADDLGLSLYSLSSGLCWDYRLSDDDKNMRIKAKEMIKKQLYTAKLLGVKAGTAPSFKDSDKMASWASDAIKTVTAIKASTGSSVMGGVGNDMFDPTGAYTSEQSILTVYRLFMS